MINLLRKQWRNRTMAQYVDKSVLVAEIEKRYNECLERAKIIDADYWNGEADAYRNVLVILDNTPEVKNTDMNTADEHEKQQWIDDTVDWLKNSTCGYLKEEWGDVVLDREALANDYALYKKKTNRTMKANELMIGDWVLFSGNPKKVTSLLVTDLGVDQIYVFGKSCQVATISEYIEPIPLTGEILEKNFSADKQWGENGWFLNDHIHIYHITTGVYNIQYMEIVNIQYVHELQHALRLCGIDKEIQL